MTKREWRERQIKAGICVRCGRRSARTGYRDCLICAARTAELRRKRENPNGNPPGRRQQYVYTISDSVGNVISEGSAAETAEKLGVSVKSVKSYADKGCESILWKRNRQLVCRRRIGEEREP